MTVSNRGQTDFQRFRRLRGNPAIRRMVAETRLQASDFIYPIFVTHGRGVRNEIASMPGQFQVSIDQLADEARELRRLGVGGVLLFGLPSEKDPLGKEAYAPDGIVQDAVRALKDADPALLVVCDVCLCEYTDHGHCGIVSQSGEVENDTTLELLAQIAVTQVEAGADLVAPSDMMDGHTVTIRTALDDSGHLNAPIMAYAAKYASAFYGPFRVAAESTAQFGDRRGYQMDPPNSREAIREIAAEIEEGADIVMVKPALPYLDVLSQARASFDLPLAAYNVSGEYAMIKAAAANGWIDGRAATLEALTGMKRAGANILISYHAKEAAAWLAE